MKKIRSYTSIWSVEKVLYAINDVNLPFPVTFTQMTWFMSQKTFDNKRPLGFLRSVITYFTAQKITFAGRPVKSIKAHALDHITHVRRFDQ